VNFYSSFYSAKSFLRHWLLKVDEHSIHSPFFYDFYQKVIKAPIDLTDFAEIETTRNKLLQDPTPITVKDLGARSNHFSNSQRTIAQIAQTSLSPTPLCLLMAKMIQHMGSQKMIELGTSMGIMSLYLASKKDVHLTTFEGSTSMANIALTNFEYFEKKNIELKEGDIDDTLSEFLQTPSKLDLVLMDANHRYEPTLRYFELLTKRMATKGIIVLDDIYHSQEMSKAWNELKHHELVYGSIDLFRCGVLFFDHTLNKQHFVWSF
jgi:predicted O-methyltransferase YrrM